MTFPHKFRLIIDLDRAGNPIQATLELHSLDSRTVHRVTTWEPGPFEGPHETLMGLIRECQERYGTQLELPL